VLADPRRVQFSTLEPRFDDLSAVTRRAVDDEQELGVLERVRLSRDLFKEVGEVPSDVVRQHDGGDEGLADVG